MPVREFVSGAGSAEAYGRLIARCHSVRVYFPILNRSKINILIEWMMEGEKYRKGKGKQPGKVIK